VPAPASAPSRPRPEHSPVDLLGAYLPGSFFYCSPTGVLLADGVHTMLTERGAGRSASVAHALAEAAAAGHPDPVLVGAIGFHPDAPASLVVPAVVRRAGPLGGHRPPRAPEAVEAEDWSVRHRTTPADYTGAVRRALRLIEQGRLRKVVLARCVELIAGEPVAVPAVLERLVGADPAVSALELAEALHPTPAVCGVPTAEARAAIAELERVDRGYYSGLVGWSGANGDGEWVVTLRGAEVHDRTLRMFAGAGVVAGSDPELELAETGAKLRTMLRAIGAREVL